MESDNQNARRDFLKRLAATSAVAGLAPTALASASRTIPLRTRPPVAANNRLQLGLIGAGIIGFVDTETALRVPGVELVAAADCYDSRLTHVKEVFGDHVFATRDYREVIGRSDVDAVIVSTPDHWHATIAREAMQAGKHVYCEKPMVHDLEEGPRVIQTQKETGRVLQVGSQRVSSVVYQKAKELYEAGAIGELNMVESQYNRNSAIGAWQYSIPPNISAADVAWERFLGDTPDRPFDPDRFFRWRKYWDYGTGMAGDLFVHLFSGLHHVLGSKGPARVVSTGGLRFWTKKREVPDVQLGLYEYPETETHPPFTLSLQSNFADGSGGGSFLRLIGSEGAMLIDGGSVTLSRSVRQRPALEQLVEGYNSVRTFSEAVQEEFIEAYRSREHTPDPGQGQLEGTSEFAAPEGYDDRFDHFVNFFEAIREGAPVVEDATFGYRAAAAALLTNLSYRNKQLYSWDPVAMEMISH